MLPVGNQKSEGMKPKTDAACYIPAIGRRVSIRSWRCTMSSLIQLSHSIPVVVACRRFPAGLASVLACSRTAGQLHSSPANNEDELDDRASGSLNQSGIDSILLR